MRNVVIHAYDRVEPDILWDTFKDDFPGLIRPLKNLLKSVNKNLNKVGLKFEKISG